MRRDLRKSNYWKTVVIMMMISHREFLAFVISFDYSMFRVLGDLDAIERPVYLSTALRVAISILFFEGDKSE